MLEEIRNDVEMRQAASSSSSDRDSDEDGSEYTVDTEGNEVRGGNARGGAQPSYTHFYYD